MDQMTAQPAPPTTGGTQTPLPKKGLIIIGPWIFVDGDVHSNTRINTPGGP